MDYSKAKNLNCHGFQAVGQVVKNIQASAQKEISIENVLNSPDFQVEGK